MKLHTEVDLELIRFSQAIEVDVELQEAERQASEMKDARVERLRKEKQHIQLQQAKDAAMKRYGFCALHITATLACLNTLCLTCDCGTAPRSEHRHSFGARLGEAEVCCLARRDDDWDRRRLRPSQRCLGEGGGRQRGRACAHTSGVNGQLTRSSLRRLGPSQRGLGVGRGGQCECAGAHALGGRHDSSSIPNARGDETDDRRSAAFAPPGRLGAQDAQNTPLSRF